MNKTLLTSLTVISITASLALAAPNANKSAGADETRFETLLKQIQADPGAAKEAQVQEMLALAKSLGKCHSASLVVRGYLSHHFQPSPELMRAMGEAAYLAGDYTFASARLKSYLMAASPSRESSEAAALLYTLLIDQFEAAEDAYQFLAKFGVPFRAYAPARRLDGWFLERARSRGDVVAAARLLESVVANALPQAQERMYYGPYFNWLADAIARPDTKYFDALSACQKIAQNLRADKVTKARLAFLAANLAFQASSAGKDESAMARDLAPTLSAAGEYLDASATAETLREICEVLAGGKGGFNGNVWQQAQEPKRAWFVRCFEKLPDAQKLAFLGYNWAASALASPEQWAGIAEKNAKLLSSTPAAGNIPLPIDQIKTADQCAKYAEILRSANNENAAIVRALAAGGELTNVLDALVKNDAWQLSYNYSGPVNRILRIWRQMHEGDQAKTSDAYCDKAYLSFGAKHLCNSPAAIYDTAAVARYLQAVWNSASNDPTDKSAVAGYLEKLSWSPIGLSTARRAGRQELVAGLNTWVKQWSDSLRAASREKNAPADLQKKLAQIAPVTDAIRLFRDRTDASKAPSPLCKAMAEFYLNSTREDTARVAAEKAVYALVRNFARDKTPYGRQAMLMLTEPSRRSAVALSFQMEMLGDLLTDYIPSAQAGQDDFVARVLAQIGQRETGPKAKDEGLKVAEILGQAIARLADKGEFSPMLFDAFRGYRVVRGKTGGKIGQDAMIKVIEKGLFQKTGYRPDHNRCRSATVACMYLIRNEFPELAEKYPLKDYFDNMFVEEARKAKFLDCAYWDYAQDSQGKIAGLAAELLSADDLPIGDDREGTYSVATLVRGLSTALKRDSALRKATLDKIEAAYGKTRFDPHAMGLGRFADGQAPEPADRGQFFAALGTFIDRASEAPIRVSMPMMAQLSSVDAKSLTDAEAATLVKIFTQASPPNWARGLGHDKALELLLNSLKSKNRWADMLALAGPSWKLCRDLHDWNFIRQVAGVADEMRRIKNQDVALAYSSAGLSVMQRDLPAELRSQLTSVRTWATAEMGGMIPVTKGNPLYQLYEAQLAYLGGRHQSAWQAYAANRAKLLKSFKEFDPMFCAWVIEKETEFKDYDAAEALAREIMAWFDEVPQQIEAEARAQIQLSYANIAAARGDRPRARALYERIVANKDFAGTRSQMDADLAIADVDTQDGNYDKAIERLTDLSRRKNPYIVVESAYHLALVKYAQEEYSAAAEQLETVFALNSDHADGRILEGRVNLKLKKLEQPTDIDLGEKIGRKYIIPGQPVRVTLVDQNLSVVRKAMEIEIRAWSDSGDEELFTLTPFGDSKTRFKGQLATAMGSPAKGDKVLQVLGKDKVHYAFSDAFASAQKIEFNSPFTLQVVSDAELYASSGTILTREQREAQALEDMIRARLGEPKDDPNEPQAALSTVRRFDQIKPGNQINVRVIDPDRNETPGRDRVTVRVAASSGDSIAEFELVETADYSGVFEGSVPTTTAQATAYASDSLEGSEANFTISKKDYPAWVGLPKTSKNRPKTLSVNLNDNVALGKMKIEAREQGRKLKEFQVQTSFNGQEFTTVASWPTPHVPWAGQATATFARWLPDETDEATDISGLPTTLAGFRDYLEQGYIRQGAPAKATVEVKNLSASWDYKLLGQGRTLGLDGAKTSKRYYVAHIKAAFYQPRRMVRKFSLTPRNASNDPTRPINYILVLDGQQASAVKGSDAIEIKQTLGKGMHVLEVYVSAEQNANPSFEVSCDTQEPPYVIPCPDEMFDLAKHPEISAGLAAQPATVQADKDNAVFELAFPADCRAKILRLLITDFETDAPAVNRITLTDAAGKEVLPTRGDFMDLRGNGVLEMIPGDRVTVTYRDPSVLTMGKQQHEAFLVATNTDATLRACFVEHTLTKTAHRTSTYVGMRRFGPGDAINVFINDPDGDVSDKQDVLKFTARTSEGKPVELDALETETHSGVFLGVVFPVAGDPNRPSELKVKPGDDVILSYMDKENINPGIPWKREFSVEQVWYAPPQVRVYDVTSLPLEEADRLAGRTDKSRVRRRTLVRDAGQEGALLNENVPDRRALMAVRPESPEQSNPSSLVIGGPVLVEVLFPAITKSEQSECSVYAQTSGGRQKAGLAPDGPFDPKVPGTIKLTRRPGDSPAPPAPPGYSGVAVHGNPFALPAIDEGRYTFSLPMQLGAVPDSTFVAEDDKAREKRADDEREALYIAGNDEIYIGLNYKDADGKDQWLVRKARLTGDSFFDVMERRYEEPLVGAYVGESVYFRVIDPAMDANDAKDVVPLELTTQSGRKRTIELVETFSHSGVFKGVVRLVHADDKSAADDPGTIQTIYGDVVTAKYVSPKTAQSSASAVEVYKGADGKVLPFTKRFKDPAMAVHTQFLIAESYFEQAKRHRQLGEDSLARREIAQGKKLLEEAIADYPSTTARAQAEYLLADLALESGNDAKNPELRKKHYMDAIERYGEIVASYGDSEYAPKAQYRKALAYEKMEMLDEACEEYVKLSYRYPENPLVAETIARLGNYFMTRGQNTLEDANKQPDPVKAAKTRMQGFDMFKTGGQVFGRFSERFPDHALAGKTMLLSAQCFMQAEDYRAAIKGYDAVALKPNMDKDLVAEAMYWAGHTYMLTKDLENAYRKFSRLTEDYPASKWAKFARGRLQEPEMLEKIMKMMQ